jgi:hypothetical protein
MIKKPMLSWFARGPETTLKSFWKSFSLPKCEQGEDRASLSLMPSMHLAESKPAVNTGRTELD